MTKALPTPTLTPAHIERFWSKVEKANGCWNWTGTISDKGYGLVRCTIDGKERTLRAHRTAYELVNDTIPNGMFVDHKCHNRSCVNPDHLRLATKKQNNENLSGALPGSKSGVRGVHWNTRKSRWVASVRHNRKLYCCGYFRTVAEAEAVVVAKRNELFTHNILDRTQTPA